MSGKYLIFGATGSIGSSLSKMMAENKQDVQLIGRDEESLKNSIIKFRNDEIHHKNIAYDNGASKEGLYSIFDKIIKTGSKVAINISEKI